MTDKINKIQFVVRGGDLPNGTYGMIIEVGNLPTRDMVNIIGKSFSHMLLERFSELGNPEEISMSDLGPDRKVN